MRAILGSGLVAGGLLLATLAQASVSLSLPEAPAPASDASGHAGLLRLWASVGKCVVRRDRAAAIAFVKAPAGSSDSIDAARRLDPVFVGCLAGSRVPGPSSVVLRRAAVANALGLRDRT